MHDLVKREEFSNRHTKEENKCEIVFFQFDYSFVLVSRSYGFCFYKSFILLNALK